MTTKGEANIPSWRTDLGKRLSEVIEKVGGEAVAAQLMDKSVKQLRRYVTGESEPPVGVFAVLARKAGVTMDWLITGWSPPPYWEEDDESYLARLEARRAEEAPPATPPIAQPEPARSEPDEELMRAIGNGVDTVYREFGARLGPGDIARLAERVRVDVVNSGARTTDEKQVAMRVSLDHLRRELRQPAANTGKGSACS